MKNLLLLTLTTFLLTSCVTSTTLSEAFVDQKAHSAGNVSIAEAVHDGGYLMSGKIPAKQRVVVLGFVGPDESEASWASDELLHYLVNVKKHSVIDRRGLDVRMAERTPTGEILERSAKDIGYLVGAEVVLFGSLSQQYRNSMRYLNLKAMDIRSGDIIATTTERFAG
jgi:hypothetical protein